MRPTCLLLIFGESHHFLGSPVHEMSLLYSYAGRPFCLFSKTASAFSKSVCVEEHSLFEILAPRSDFFLPVLRYWTAVKLPRPVLRFDGPELIALMRLLHFSFCRTSMHVIAPQDDPQMDCTYCAF